MIGASAACFQRQSLGQRSATRAALFCLTIGEGSPSEGSAGVALQPARRFHHGLGVYRVLTAQRPP